jgi:glutathione S-transferase
MRLHVIPHSTNADRVRLALGLKGLEAELVSHDPGDRSALRALSGQDLVPVLETSDGQVLTDSMPIVAWIDATWPQPPLYPADPLERTRVEAFVAFFNYVWKVPPNALADGDHAAGSPEALIARLRGFTPMFDGLLAGRDFLFGDAPGAADLCAYPFLKYATSRDPDDDDLFHGVLIEHLAPGAGLPNLPGWIERMALLPMAGQACSQAPANL